MYLVRKLFVICLSICILGCESHEYYAQSMHAVNDFHTLLLQQGICSSIEDCQKKEVVFISSGRGVHIQIFGVTNLVVLSAIKKQSEELWTSPAMRCVPEFSVKVYQHSRSEHSLAAKPFQYYRFSKEKCDA